MQDALPDRFVLHPSTSQAAAEAAATEPPPATVTFAADLGPSEEAFATAMEKAAADFAAFMAELEAPKAWELDEVVLAMDGRYVLVYARKNQERVYRHA